MQGSKGFSDRKSINDRVVLIYAVVSENYRKKLLAYGSGQLSQGKNLGHWNIKCQVRQVCLYAQQPGVKIEPKIWYHISQGISYSYNWHSMLRYHCNELLFFILNIYHSRTRSLRMKFNIRHCNSVFSSRPTSSNLPEVKLRTVTDNPKGLCLKSLSAWAKIRTD